MLFNATRDFNDRRVVDAVMDVARQTTADETTRIYAFALLYSSAMPPGYLDVDDLLNPGDTPAAMGWFTHDTRTRVTRAVLGDLHEEVRAVLQSIAESEPGTRVGIAAGAVLRRIR